MGTNKLRKEKNRKKEKILMRAVDEKQVISL